MNDTVCINPSLPTPWLNHFLFILFHEMLRTTSKLTYPSVRFLYQTSKVTFQQRQSFLDKYRTDQESIEAPTKLASESTLPVIEQDLKIKPRQPKTKAPFLSEDEDKKIDCQIGKKKLDNLLFLHLESIWINLEVVQ